MRTHHRTLLPALFCVAVSLPLATRADDDGARMPAQVPKAYTQECAGCHMAFPPGLLPAASWRRMMNSLEQHYGSDASLEPAVVKELSDWLQANAAQGRRARADSAPPEDRITRTRWFVREHREIAPSVFRRQSIKSAANCMACHADAERGDFDDDGVRIPK